MLNYPARSSRQPASPKQIGADRANADWCVGDASVRWDVSFTDRLMFTVRKLFTRNSLAPLNEPGVFASEHRARDAA